jgi:hypothetical protein
VLTSSLARCPGLGSLRELVAGRLESCAQAHPHQKTAPMASAETASRAQIRTASQSVECSRGGPSDRLRPVEGSSPVRWVLLCFLSRPGPSLSPGAVTHLGGPEPAHAASTAPLRLSAPQPPVELAHLSLPPMAGLTRAEAPRNSFQSPRIPPCSRIHVANSRFSQSDVIVRSPARMPLPGPVRPHLAGPASRYRALEPSPPPPGRLGNHLCLPRTQPGTPLASAVWPCAHSPIDRATPLRTWETPLFLSRVRNASIPSCAHRPVRQHPHDSHYPYVQHRPTSTPHLLQKSILSPVTWPEFPATNQIDSLVAFVRYPRAADTAFICIHEPCSRPETVLCTPAGLSQFCVDPRIDLHQG